MQSSTDAFNLDWSKILFCSNLTHTQTISMQYKSFENNVGKGEIAHNGQFLFPTMFSTYLENFLLFLSNFILLSANSFSLEESEICCLGKG